MSLHECPIPDEVLPLGDEAWWRPWCLCIPKRGKGGQIWVPTEIAPPNTRINGPASPAIDCPCECHA